MTHPSDKAQDRAQDRAKARARRLRVHLASKGISLSHAQSLEAIAHEEGFRDWNTYHASLETEEIPMDDRCPFETSARFSGLYYNTPVTGHVRAVERTATTGVWKLTLHFDRPAEISGGQYLKYTRQRVKVVIDRHGRSVTALGEPDGHAQIAPA